LAEYITINILGKEYSIKSDAQEHYVNQIGEYINQKISGILKTTKAVATHNILVLVAMDIANDYFQVRDLNQKLTDTIETKSANLIDYIDSHI